MRRLILALALIQGCSFASNYGCPDRLRWEVWDPRHHPPEVERVNLPRYYHGEVVGYVTSVCMSLNNQPARVVCCEAR